MFPTMIWSGFFFDHPLSALRDASTARSSNDLFQWSAMSVKPTELT